MKKFLSKEHGITMLMIVLMVVVMLVILLVVTFYAKNSIPMENFQKMKADIKEIEAKAQMYYMSNKALPIITSDSKSSVEGDFINPNDEGDYFLVDTERLGVVPTYNTKYYINAGSHTVYADKIIEINGKRYSRFKDDFDLLTEKPNNIPKWEEECFDKNIDSDMFTYDEKNPSIITGFNEQWLKEHGGDGTNVWNIVIPAYKNDGTVITGIRDGAFSDNKIWNSIKIPSTIQNIGSDILGGVTTEFLYLDAIIIDKDAFKNCTNIQGVILGPSAGLPDVGNKSEGIFANMTSIQWAAVDTTSLGKYAFAGCAYLNEIYFTNRIQEIPEGCFMDCREGLRNMYSSDGLGDVADKSSLGGIPKAAGLPSMLETIGDKAFMNAPFNSVTIPEKVETIGVDAFRGCSSLGGILEFSTALKSIGTGAFVGTNVQKFRIPKTTEVAANAYESWRTTERY